MSFEKELTSLGIFLFFLKKKKREEEEEKVDEIFLELIN
jgi:hypothetical protein